MQRFHTASLSYTFLLTFLCTTFLLQWDSFHILLTIVAISSIGAAMMFAHQRIGHGKPCPYLPVMIIACVGLLIAAFRVHQTTHTPTPHTIDTYATKQFVEIQGTIVREPDRRPLQTKYTVEANSLTYSGTTIDQIDGLVLATTRSVFPRFQYGDQVIVSGMLEKPGRIEKFHYDRYLSRFDIYSVMYSARFQKIGEGDRNPLLAFLFDLKANFEAQINKLYPEPHASFMAGILTGSRKGIPEDLMENFNITGLTHIIAISGYNITIVIAIIGSLLFWLPLRARFLPSVLAIIAFTLFVGCSAAVVRASIMGILGLLALQSGRQQTTRLTILWAAFLMIIWNPKILWYDAGFQLSFLAVVGLTELGPLIEKYFTWAPKTLAIRESLQMTMAAQLSAVPLIILLFGRLSLIAPIANLLIAPAIPLAMLFGFVGTVLSTIWFLGGQLIAYLGWGCLQWVIWVAETLARVPFATVETKIGPWVFGGYYVLLVILIAWRQGISD